MLQELNFRIKSLCPLLFHNGQLADPLNTFSKELKKVSSKRVKTDADQEEMGRLEWFGSWYLSDGKPCIPAQNFKACLVEGAKKFKLGKTSKSAIWVNDHIIIEHDGPDNIEEMWGDERFVHRALVSVQRNKVARTRPIIDSWEADVKITFDDEMLTKEEVERIIETAGLVAGVGDWRPQYGRFGVL